MTSTRLPGKVLMPICGKPVLAHVIGRVSSVPGVGPCVVATTTNKTDDPVVELAESLGVTAFRGSESDVLARFSGAAGLAGADAVIRITADCPLIDPAIIARVVDVYRTSGADYAANTLIRTYPIGMDTEVFSRTALETAAAQATAPDEREHVTLHIYRNPTRFRLCNVAAPPELARPMLRLTLDTAADLELITAVIEALHPAGEAFSLADVLSLLAARPALEDLNRDVPHNWVAR